MHFINHVSYEYVHKSFDRVLSVIQAQDERMYEPFSSPSSGNLMQSHQVNTLLRFKYESTVTYTTLPALAELSGFASSMLTSMSTVHLLHDKP